MSRLVLVLLIGLTLGALVHLVTIMAIPRLAQDDGWSRVMALASPAGVTLLPRAGPADDGVPLLDPSAAHAVCLFDLSRGPMSISAPMPPGFWSVSLFGEDRAVFYAVTRAATNEDVFTIELRNAVQTRRARIAQADPDPATLQVEAPSNGGFALFRALVTGRSERAIVEEALAGIQCEPLSE